MILFTFNVTKGGKNIFGMIAIYLFLQILAKTDLEVQDSNFNLRFLDKNSDNLAGSCQSSRPFSSQVWPVPLQPSSPVHLSDWLPWYKVLKHCLKWTSFSKYYSPDQSILLSWYAFAHYPQISNSYFILRSCLGTCIDHYENNQFPVGSCQSAYLHYPSEQISCSWH